MKDLEALSVCRISNPTKIFISIPTKTSLITSHRQYNNEYGTVLV